MKLTMDREEFRVYVWAAAALAWLASYWRSGGRTDTGLAFLSWGLVYLGHRVLYDHLRMWTEREMTGEPEAT